MRIFALRACAFTFRAELFALAQIRQNRIENRNRAEQDYQDRRPDMSARTGGCHNRTAGIIQPGQTRKDMTARTGQAVQDDRQKRTGRTGQAGPNRQNRTGLTGHAEYNRQNKAGSTRLPGQDC